MASGKIYIYRRKWGEGGLRSYDGAENDRGAEAAGRLDDLACPPRPGHASLGLNYGRKLDCIEQMGRRERGKETRRRHLVHSGAAARLEGNGNFSAGRALDKLHHLRSVSAA